MVLDPSSITPAGLLELAPVSKYFIRKMNRVRNLLTLGSSALFCPYLAPGVVCYAVSKLVEKIPPHDHTPFYKIKLNQRDGKSFPRYGPYGAWTDLGGLKSRHGEVLRLQLGEGHWKLSICAQIFDRDRLDVALWYFL